MRADDRRRGPWREGARLKYQARADALALLPPRVCAALAVEWGRPVFELFEAKHGKDERIFRPIEAARSWVLSPNPQALKRVTTESLGGNESALRLAEDLSWDSATMEKIAAYCTHYAADAISAIVHNEVAIWNWCAEAVASRLAEYANLLGISAPGRRPRQKAGAAAWTWLARTYARALGPGYPFDPAWKTDTAVALARGICADRALDRMPILADALQDAGLSDPALIAHLQNNPDQWTTADWVLWNLLGYDEEPK